MLQQEQSEAGTRDVTQKRWMKKIHSPVKLTLKLHQWLLILFVGQQENTQVTTVQAVKVVGDVMRPAAHLISGWCTTE